MKQLICFLFVIGIFTPQISNARERTYSFNKGQRCSEMCPKARKKATAECEDIDRVVNIKDCECNEAPNFKKNEKPTATVTFSCKKQ